MILYLRRVRKCIYSSVMTLFLCTGLLMHTEPSHWVNFRGRVITLITTRLSVRSTSRFFAPCLFRTRDMYDTPPRIPRCAFPVTPPVLKCDEQIRMDPVISFSNLDVEVHNSRVGTASKFKNLNRRVHQQVPMERKTQTSVFL